MRRFILVVLFVEFFLSCFSSQVMAEESFSVKKGCIVIITVGEMQVAIFNEKKTCCGTLYIIEPKTREIKLTYIIPEKGVHLIIGGEEISVKQVFSAVGSKKNAKLESRPSVLKS